VLTPYWLFLAPEFLRPSLDLLIRPYGAACCSEMNYPAACRREFHPITIDAFVKIIKPDGTVKASDARRANASLQQAG
jgi:hypothetical protein